MNDMTRRACGRMLISTMLIGCGAGCVGYAQGVNTDEAGSLQKPWDSDGMLAPGWYECAPLPQPLRFHTATLLPDGKVIVLGGMTYAEHQDKNASGIRVEHFLTDQIHIYDVVQNSWQPAGHLPSAFAGHAATLLTNGQVLVTGGRHSDVPGGESDFRHEALLYDPTSHGWREAAPMHKPRAEHQAFLLADGRVLVTQSRRCYPACNSMQHEVTAEIYDPVADAWEELPIPAVRPESESDYRNRQVQAVVLTDQKRVAWIELGGVSHTQPEGRADRLAAIYDSSTGQWQLQYVDLSAGVGAVLVALAGGCVLAAGGQLDGFHGSTQTVLYDLDSGERALLAPMHEERFGAQAAMLDTHRLLVAGGACVEMNSRTGAFGALTSEIWDMRTRQWQLLPPLPQAMTASEPAYRHTAVPGVKELPMRYRRNYMGTSERLGGGALDSMLMQQTWAQTVCLADGRVLLIGGSNADSSFFEVTDAVQMFVPQQE